MPSSAISASESLHRAPSPVLVGPSSSPLLLSPAVAHQLLEDFKGLVRRDVAVPVAAMHALVSVIRASDAVINGMLMSFSNWLSHLSFCNIINTIPTDHVDAIGAGAARDDPDPQAPPLVRSRGPNNALSWLRLRLVHEIRFSCFS